MVNYLDMPGFFNIVFIIVDYLFTAYSDIP